jgi:lipoate-protein ligase A
MQLLHLTLNTAAENLALDEALLDAAEAGEGGEILRLWEPAAPLVVMGRSSRVASEVNVTRCAELGIPILRRASGGAAIVTGPGCLMYAVVLSYERWPELRMLDRAHWHVLSRLAGGLAEIGIAAEHCGTSDLALAGRKFSGNSLRCKRDHLLYHGTLLYDFPLDLVGQVLLPPPRQPDYRAGRAHGEFVVNLPASAATIRSTVAAAFDARQPALHWPRERTERLAAERYRTKEWNFGR